MRIKRRAFVLLTALSLGIAGVVLWWRLRSLTGESYTLLSPDGLQVTSLESETDQLTVMAGAVLCRFHTRTSKAGQMLNVTVERWHLGKYKECLGGLGTGIPVGEPASDKLDHDCTVVVIPMGSSFVEAESLKVAVSIDAAGSTSTVVQNPFRGLGAILFG